ncbi:CHAT domain-containing protein [Marixanthomonas ophiurae]|uniref:CHAT domain-containing protein n=1 Tax=Marixanthomonas ophiurae TaxID=387659 RepID=A0A3E1Q9W8_9FLAO|nr:CHAT domain-containing tetratricopeptide repeat protein [Marixanthomonas ophiurae]RFN58917.1 CHAT domain-containing protein [Marixanthomonas ophiurae]
MKKITLLLLLFFSFQSFFAQISKNKKAEELFSNEAYTEAISVRKKILKSIDDKDSDAYKRQLYKIKATESYLASDYAEMLSLVEQAIEVFNGIEEPSTLEKIEINIEYFNVLIPNGKLEKAWQVASETYDFTLTQQNDEKYGSQLAKIFQGLGNIKWFLQEWETAIPYFKKAIEKTTEVYGYYSVETAKNCRLLSTLYTFTPDFNTGLDYGLKAQKIYEKIQPEDKFLLFQQYANNLTSFKQYGDLEKTEELLAKLTGYFNKNKTYLLNYEHQDFPNLSAAKTIYLYKKLEYATARQDFNEAEQVYARFQREIMPKIIQPYSEAERNTLAKFSLETGSLFHRSGNYEKAKKYYSNALKFSQSIDYNFGILQAYWILSTAAADNQKWDDVIHYVDLAFENPEIEKFNQSMTMRNNLGHAYFGKGNYDKAFAVFNKVLKHYFSADEEINNFHAIQNLNEIAGVYLKMHQKQSDSKYLEEAYKAYHLSSVIFSRLYRGGKFNDRLATYQDQINEGMLLCTTMLDEHFQETAERVEINNSDLLWSRFLNNQEGSGLEGTRLQAKIDSLITEKEKTKFTAENDTGATVDSLKTKLEKLTNSITEAQTKIEKNHPSFYQFSQKDFDLKSLQSKISKNELILRYVLTDSMVFAYGITKNNLLLKRLPVDKVELRKSIDDYLSDLKNFKTSYLEKSKKLFAVLIEPMSVEKYDKLTIINDGFLGYLPFETLISENKSFLLENYQISYSTSLKLWSIQNENNEGSSTKFTAFSPKYKLSFAANTEDKAVKDLVREGNYELLGAEREAKTINALFDGRLYTAEEATKNNFVSNVSSYDVLHLAMHAVLDEDNPAKSSLIFENNEKLYLPEFYKLKIPAQLAVLSACNTGVGEIKRGEGVQSLSRAFTYAGVKSTVMSLWPAPDKETPEIMVSFYKNLKKGENKAQALQQAKLDYLKNTKTEKLQHPFYWAGFVLSGDNSPIQFSKPLWKQPLFYIILVSVLAILLVVIYFRKRKNNSTSL